MASTTPKLVKQRQPLNWLQVSPGLHSEAAAAANMNSSHTWSADPNLIVSKQKYYFLTSFRAHCCNWEPICVSSKRLECSSIKSVSVTPQRDALIPVAALTLLAGTVISSSSR